MAKCPVSFPRQGAFCYRRNRLDRWIKDFDLQHKRKYLSGKCGWLRKEICRQHPLFAGMGKLLEILQNEPGRIAVLCSTLSAHRKR